jgi:hypothetical protein
VETRTATVVELATISVSQAIDFAECQAAFPLANLDSIDDTLASRLCRGEFTPSADLSSMIVLLGLEAASKRRFSGSQDPFALVRSLCAHFVSALERWPDGAGGNPRWVIDGEANVQRLLYFLFRAAFASTVYEDPQPKDGLRSTRPDFGIRDLRLAIEAKYVRRADQLASVQQEVESDAAGFFPGSGRYNKLLVFIYDASRSTDRHAALQARLKQLPNVADAFVVSPPTRLIAPAATPAPPRSKRPGSKARTPRGRPKASTP